MLFTLPWSDLTFVQVQSPGSYLRASYAIGRAFGLQGPDELVALVEDTTETSRLMLRLPTPMTGMFLDAVTGDVLGELTVEASLSTDPPTRVDVPTDLQAVILRLKARD
jgi:hypothetical protein